MIILKVSFVADSPDTVHEGDIEFQFSDSIGDIETDDVSLIMFMSNKIGENLASDGFDDITSVKITSVEKVQPTLH